MIPDDFIESLLNRVDIVEVVERHVPLRKAGANYVACCPFHQEKTPSFTVSASKQFYHCFGCGAHGTAIRFLMEHTGRGFVEVVEELAERVGLSVPQVAAARTGEAPAKRGPELREALVAAAQFYKSKLKESARAIAYLKQRGLSGEIAARFGIGYAPAGWQPLVEVFANYEDAVLETAGLVIVNEAGKRYDRFRDRIMFPILDSRGQAIGFGGRVLDQGEPKYLNSPETPLFAKGRELYGLAQARKAIQDAGRILVVEGYMDVVALAQMGVGYAVATLGTATTPVHAQKLFRQSDQIVFCFDGDNAGRKAAWRALENVLPSLADGKNASFLFLPEGEDPDTYVRRNGSEAFEQLIGRSALPLSDYLMQELAARHPVATDEGRAAFLAAAGPYLEQVGAPILAGLLKKRIAQMAGLSADEGASMLPVMGRRLRREAPVVARPRSRVTLELSIIKCLLAMPELIGQCPLAAPEPNSAEAQALRRLLEVLRQDRPGSLSTASLLQSLGEGAGQAVFERALTRIDEEALDAEALRAEFEGSVARYLELVEGASVASLLKARSLASLSPDELARVRASLARRRPATAVE